MASLIDETYFVNDITIPNPASTDVANKITGAITKYEKEILIKLLGYPLYKLLIANPTVEPYKSLIEGADFSFELNGRTINEHWNGLTNTDLVSLISYFVYYNIINNTTSKTVGIGEILSMSENGERISPISKMVNAWNNMVDLYGLIEPEVVRYSGFNKNDNTSYVHQDDMPSAFNYLLAHIDVFETWIFTPKFEINEFGF